MLEASVDLPLSKSISARALIINKIGGFEAPAEVAQCDDTEVLKQALEKTTGCAEVEGAGTAMRFLTAYYAATPGVDIVLDGNERMRQRPIAALVEALRTLGADITYMDKSGFAPIKIVGKQLSGGEVKIDSTISSQFISALMMIAPTMKEPLHIMMDGEPVSLPYLKMTGSMMENAGAEVEFLYNGIKISNQPYTAALNTVERDWSAASYWYAITTLSAGWVTLNGMSLPSLQGDSAMVGIGEKFGVITSDSEEVEDALELSVSPEQFSRIDHDMSATPDLVPTVAVAAAALGIPFRFTGVKTLRDKECDRLEALRLEALKFGWVFNIEGDDILGWEGQRIPIEEMPTVSTYNDHRIALAFAPVSIFLPGLVIKEAEVIAKSYPDFWTQLEQCGFIIETV